MRESLKLPTRNCRRRSLPCIPVPQVILQSSNEEEFVSSEGPDAVKRDLYHPHQRRSSLRINQNRALKEYEAPKYFEENQYKYQEHPNPLQPYLHFQSPDQEDSYGDDPRSPPIISSSIYMPKVMLEFPSEESSRRPSKCSATSSSANPFPEIADLLVPSPSMRPLHRRETHAGNLGQSISRSPSQTVQPFLNVPKARTRGSSLPDKITTSELYRLRNFATSGRRVINKGDSFRSRNSSIHSSRSR